MTIKEMRAKTGLTQAKICQVTGVPMRTWQHWEMGDREVPAYVVRLIRYFLEHEQLFKDQGFFPSLFFMCTLYTVCTPKLGDDEKQMGTIKTEMY